MKSNRIVFCIFLIVLIFSIKSTQAASPNDSTTILTIPTLSVATPVTLSTSTSYSSGWVFLGSVDYFALENTVKLGYTTPSLTTTVNDPKITFTPNQDIPFWVLRVPIVAIGNLAQMNSDIPWSIKDGTATIISGFIETNVVSSMVAEGSLYLIVNSAQTSTSPKITLISGIEYTLEFNDNDGLTYSFDTQTSGSPLLFDGLTSTGNSVQLIFYDGQHIGKVATTDGTTSINYSPSSSVNQIITYYGYATGFFGQSYDIVTIIVQDDPNYTLSYPDVSANNGELTIFQAILEENSIPKSGVNIEFDLFIDNFYQNLGIDISDVSGIATINWTIDLIPGTIYTIRARAQLPSNQIDTFAILEVQLLTGSFSNTNAIGYYASGAGNNTKVVINGYLLTDTMAAISDMVVEFWDSSIKLTSNLTEPSGYFEMYYEQPFSLGSYPGYFLKVNNPEYDISDLAIIINIYQAIPQIILNISSIETTFNSSVVISGVIQDQSGDFLSANIFLEQFVGTWILIDSLSSVSFFEFSLDTTAVGQHTLRVRNEGTVDVSSVSQQISLVVDKANASISSDSSSYNVEFNNMMDIIVTVEDTVNNPLSGVDISLYYQDYSNASIFILFETQSSINGQVIFAFDPPQNYDINPYFSYNLIISATSPSYQLISISASFQVIATNISSNIPLIDYTYGKNSILIFDIVENGGNSGQEGEIMDLYYLGQKYSSAIQSDGTASFSLTFFEVDSVSIIIGHNSGNNYPYNPINQTVVLNLDKATRSVSSQPITGSQGETIKFYADIFDQNNRPTDVSTNLYIYLSDWTLIGSNTSVNGKFIYDYFIPATMGISTYQIKYEVPASANFYLSDGTTTLTIDSIQTQIIISGPSLYQYNSDIVDRTYSVILSTMEGMALSSRTLDISFGNYLTGVVTDANGNASFVLPQLQTPGLYNLSVFYLGDSTYTSSNSIKSVLVNGTDVFFDWIIQPQDTNYGDLMTIELGVYDTYQYLASKEISIYVDGQFIASQFTNSSGFVTISIQMLFVDTNLNIEVKANASEGWNTHSENFSIIQSPKYIDAQSYTTDMLNTTAYDVITQIILFTEYQGLIESGVLADLYLYDGVSYQLIFSGSTNSSGLIQTNILLPLKDAGTIYILQWRINKVFFQQTILDVSLPVVRTTPDIMISSSSATVLNDTNIRFYLTDPDGDLISNIQMTLTYSPDGYTQTLDVVDGYVEFIFVAPTSGILTLSYSITDASGNYVQISNTFDLDVAKDNIEIKYILGDEGGQAVLYIDVVSSSGNRSVSTSVSIFIDYQLQGIFTGSYILNFVMNASIHKFDFYSSSTSDFYEKSLGIVVSLETITISPPNNNVYAQVANQLIIPVTSYNSTLAGHAMLLYVDLNGWTQISSAIVQNGRVVFDINFLFDVGNYTFKISYPQQAWFGARDSTISMSLAKQDITLSIVYDEFVYSHYVNVTVYLIDERGLEIQSVYGSIQIFQDNFITLYSGILTHNTTYSLFIIQDQGIHNFAIIIDEGPAYNKAIYQESITIKSFTLLRLDSQETAYYGDENTIILQLIEPETGLPLSNQPIKIMVCGLFCSASEFVISLATDQGGVIVFSIPNEYTPNIYTFQAIFEGNDYLASSSIEFEVQVQPEELVINTLIVDFGITHNYTIMVEITDENGIYNTSGIILVQIGNSFFNYSYFGTPLELVYYGLVGSFDISVDYLPDNNYYSFSRTNDIIGWLPITDINVEFLHIGYGDDFVFNVTGNGVYLENMDIVLVIKSKTRGKTLATFNLITNQGSASALFLLPPETYMIEITFLNTTYFADGYFIRDFVIVDIGDRGFDPIIEASLEITKSIDIEIQDVIPDANYSITVFNSTFSQTIVITQQFTRLNFSDYLLPGTYNISVIRSHIYMLNVTELSTFKIIPIAVDLRITTSYDEIFLSIEPLEFIFPFWVNITISNGSLTYNYIVSSSNFTHDLLPGQYLLTYYIEGYYSGQGENVINIGFIGDQADGHTSDITPNDRNKEKNIQGENVFFGLIAIIGIGGYFGKKLGVNNQLLTKIKTIGKDNK